MVDLRERSRGRVALVVSLVILGLLAVGAVTGVSYLQNRLESRLVRIEDPFADLTDRPTNEPGSDEDADQGDPVNILFLGSDSRISAGDPEQWSAGAQRTDAIMLAQVAGNRKTATVMSIPRDSWVDIPGYGMNKINAAFSFGGPSLMIQTVEQLTGVRIDHFAVADFESFSTLTDELGGVNIELTQPLTAGGKTLEPGFHLLDGEQALAYARERYNVAGGDFGRVQRHQTWMRSMMAATFERGVLTNATRMTGFLDAMAASVAVDEGFSVEEMRSLALSARSLRAEDVRFITAPYAGTGRSPDGTQSIVLLNEPLFDGVAGAFAEDRIAEYLAANPGVAPSLGEDAEFTY
ncbi:LCP family protein [Georgenia muralis]